MSDKELRPCLIRAGDQTISIRAKNYEGARLWLDRWRVLWDEPGGGAEFRWDDDAIAHGWEEIW